MLKKLRQNNKINEGINHYLIMKMLNQTMGPQMKFTYHVNFTLISSELFFTRIAHEVFTREIHVRHNYRGTRKQRAVLFRKTFLILFAAEG